MSRSIYALLVGIDNYAPSEPPVPSLKGCVNDINAMATYLNSQIAGQWELKEPKILTNEKATRQAVIEGFQYLCQAGSDDIALFYYSGHGSQEKAPEAFWHLEPDRLDETLVCYDSRTPENHDLADKELNYLLAQVAQKNPRILVILDSCHSGSGTRNILQGVRLAPDDTRDRAVSSFIFAEDSAFKDVLNNSAKVGKKKTGLDLPKGQHILLAACRDYQYAKEYQGEDGKTRGAFSYFLLKTLEQTNGGLSYLDLSRNIEALVKGKVQDQVPQLEANNPEDLKESFLGDAIPQRPFYFTLSYSENLGDQGWEIDGGVLQGIPKPASTDETTLLALFPVGSQPDDLRQLSKALGEARVTKALTQKSKVEITQGQANLNQKQGYWAVVTSLPLDTLKIYFQGDLTEKEGIDLAKQALAEANSGQPSLYVKPVENPAEADFTLLVQNEQYWIREGERPVVAPIPQQPGYSEESAREAIQALEAIARWRNVLNLKSPQSSQIKSQDVEMEITLIGYQGKDEEIKPVQDSGSSLPAASELRLAYKYEDGEWKQPVIQVKLLNYSNQKLYANVVGLTEDYSVQVPFFDEKSSVVLPAQTAAGPGTFAGPETTLFIPDEFLAQGITEYKDIFKLIVSKTDFNASSLEQDGLKPPSKGTRGAEPENSLDRLMGRVYSRNGARAGKRYDDWIAKEVAVTIVKPREAERLQAERSVTLMNGLVEVQPHPCLQANVTLTTVSQATRAVGNLITPALLKDEAGVIESFRFTTSRGSDPGLSAVELFDVNDTTLVTKEAPLTLSVNQALADDDYILAVSHDGEFFLPLGRGVKDGERTKITLERLPEPTASNRSLGGSIKIFFKKFLSQKLGYADEYPILTTAEVREEESKITINYQPELSKPDVEEVKRRVASAQKIILYLHGIIGDTASMVGSVQQAKVAVNDQRRPLQELYDLVLTFDYENLNTTIEENARLLKQRLDAVGLGTHHGKQLHLVAHSMGGLVARWFIEREGGNQVVQQLVMLGTPNAGSPWPAVQDMAVTLLTFGLNNIPPIAWPAKVVANLAVKAFKAAEAIEKALDQMQPGSEFLEAIAHNPDPQVPYTIIAGDRSIPAELQQTSCQLLKKLFTAGTNKVVDWLFGGEANDIAVSLNSIKTVSSHRSPPPKVLPDVACDHMTYFTTEAGLTALAEALQP